MKKELSNNQKWLFVFASFILLGFSVYATTIISDTEIITPNSLTKNSDYVVYHSEGTTYSINKNGDIAFSSSGENTSIIQASLDSIGSNAHVYILGDITFDDTIYLNSSNQILEGYGTINIPDGTGITTGKSSSQVDGQTIKGFTFDGNSTVIRVGSALNKINNIRITDAYKGILIDELNDNARDTLISDVIIKETESYAIQIASGSTSDQKISNVVIGNVGNDFSVSGILLNGNSHLLSNVHVFNTGDSSIDVRGDNIIISNCYIDTSDDSGIDVFNSNGTVVTNCYIYRNGDEGINVAGNSYHTVISNNFFKDNVGVSIKTSGNSDYNNIVGNTFYNNTGTLSNTGSNNNIIGNEDEDNIIIGKTNITDTLTIGDGTNQINITLTSPDGTEYSCGVNDGGSFTCV